MSRTATNLPPELLLPGSSAMYRMAGVDEAGRGCLAGPVYAAAVILGEQLPQGLADSKQLSPAQRARLFDLIREQALAYSIARVEVEEIDRLNILRASLLAMRRAVLGLGIAPDVCWVDGNQAPELDGPVRTLVGGDALLPQIMAASILAKVARDRELKRLDAIHPQYGFARHKGYGTAQHLLALRQHGPSPLHRMSFAPCRQLVPTNIDASDVGDAEVWTIPDSRFPIPGREV